MRYRSEDFFYTTGSLDFQREDLSYEPYKASLSCRMHIVFESDRTVTGAADIAEQEEIVRRADILQRLGEDVGRRVDEALGRSDLMSQAVLAKAFRRGFSV